MQELKRLETNNGRRISTNQTLIEMPDGTLLTLSAFIQLRYMGGERKADIARDMVADKACTRAYVYLVLKGI